MNSRLSITCLFLFPFLFIKTISAQSINEIFDKTTPITFLGVDFSNAKYYGSTGTVDTAEMIGLFNKINELIIKEKDKYNLNKALKKDSIEYNLNSVIKINSETNKHTLITTDENEINNFDEDTIQTFVNKYNFENIQHNIGLVFIVETLDKTTEEESIWATFVDIKSKKVIFTHGTIGIAAGIGFRNHWAFPIYTLIDAIKKDFYYRWKKKYLN